MDARDLTTRLTEREKEVLRAWLTHKSAKEIALDLGITHHAVEKRLKMARVKLGAGSSREAARMLAEAEGYGETIAGSPDLPATAASRPTRPSPKLVVGGLVMLTLTALSLAVAAAYPSAEPADIEIEGDVGKLFAHLDDDDSGYLESPESPFVAVASLEGTGPKREGSAKISDRTGPDQTAAFYLAADTDGDHRVSLAEYTTWSKARWAELGIEVKTIVKVLPAPES